jgi:hypothetical protein
MIRMFFNNNCIPMFEVIIYIHNIISLYCNLLSYITFNIMIEQIKIETENNIVKIEKVKQELVGDNVDKKLEILEKCKLVSDKIMTSFNEDMIY